MISSGRCFEAGSDVGEGSGPGSRRGGPQLVGETGSPRLGDDGDRSLDPGRQGCLDAVGEAVGVLRERPLLGGDVGRVGGLGHSDEPTGVLPPVRRRPPDRTDRR